MYLPRASRLLGFAATLPIALGGLRAQTYVVDPAGGPGVDFTSLQGAIDAVSSGATLLVRAGSYARFTLAGKAMTLLGGAGVDVAPGSVLQGTAAGQPITVYGCRFGLSAAGIDAGLSVLGCNGAVTLVDCDWATGPVVASSMQPGLAVTGARQMVVKGGTCPWALFASSTAVLDGVVLVGHDALDQGPVAHFSTPGLHLLNGSDVQVRGGAITGGAESAGATQLVASAAVVMENPGTTQVLRLLPPMVVTAGAATALPAPPAIDAAGAVRLDPAVQLQSALFLPIRGGAVVTAPQPTAIGNDTVPGGVITGQAVSPTGTAAMLLFGLVGPPFRLPDLASPLWFDLTFAELATLGQLPIAASYTIPNSPGLRGLRLLFQAVSFDPALGFDASNPAVVLVH